MANGKRYYYIDLLKGIGIVSVVFAHSIEMLYGNVIIKDMHRFIYIFHLPLFFFVSGYLSNPNKTIKQLAKSVLKTFLALLCSCLAILAFCLMFKIYSVSEVVKHIHYILIMRYDVINSYASALWFVPCLMVSKIVFQIILWLSNLPKTKVLNKNESFVMISSLIISFIGIILTRYNILSFWHINISLSMILVMFMGLLYKKYQNKINQVLSSNIYIYIMIVIFVINAITGLELSLASRKMYKYIGLYPMILLGLVFCISLAQRIMKNELINKTLQICGNSSYYIMAYHFTIFCIIDIAYIKAFNLGQEVMFPATFPWLIPLYTILGCLIPIYLKKLIKYITCRFSIHR